MEYIFNQLYQGKEIKGIHNFNTINVSNIAAMFEECSQLEYLDLSNFDTSNVTDMEWMYQIKRNKRY